MSDIDYLNGFVYHMVHYENLRNVFRRGALLAKERLVQEMIRPRSIANDEVQNLRDRIFIWNFSTRSYWSLHNYVPFYFATHTPMLYVQYRNDLQKEIVIFEVSRSILRYPGALFTDGNASNQQLSKSQGEIVEIMPGTASNTSCRRTYFPDGPYGMNRSCSDFYSDPVFLGRLNWNIINNRWFTGDEEKRIKHAEVLVPNHLILARIRGIFVSTYDMVEAVNAAITECGLAGRIPSAMYKPALFF